MTLPPLERTIEVPCPPGRAFDVFIREIGSWWPLAQFSTAAFRGVSARLEVKAEAGGEIVEVGADGARALWGWIEDFDPPSRLGLRFHIPHPDEAVQGRTRVDVTFTAEGGGTRVHLAQSEWEKLGRLAKPLHGGYGGGWTVIFEEAYATACSSAGPQPENGEQG